MALLSGYSNQSHQIDSLQRKVQLTTSRPTQRARPRQKQRRLSPAEAGQLLDAYRAGAIAVELAARFGVHRTTVAAVLERAGKSRRHQRLARTVPNSSSEATA